MMSNQTFQFSLTSAGDLTCRCRMGERDFALHSKYQPVMEAERFIQAQLSMLDGSPLRVVVYGFACAHHIRALLKFTESSVMIDVLEMNVGFYREVIERTEVQDVLGNSRVRVLASDQLADIRTCIQSWTVEPVQLIIHEPSLQLIPTNLTTLRDVLVNYQVQQKSLFINRDKLIENLQLNQQLGLPGIERLLDEWVQPYATILAEIPVLLVAAGPSLEQQLDILRQAREQAMIVSVGRSLPLLLRAGIKPDFFMITDANPIVQTHIEDLPQDDVPMFFLSTVYHEAAKMYPGPKSIVYQHGMQYLADSEPDERVKIETGGSVATSLFELLLKFGFRNICLVGLDLAYTQGRTHAQGAMLHEQLSESQLALAPEVPNVTQTGHVKTSRSLMSFRQWFIAKARKLQSEQMTVHLCNASIGGAYIDGFEHQPLESYLIAQKEHKDIESVRSIFAQIISGISRNI
jgi:hypothetical protein